MNARIRFRRLNPMWFGVLLSGVILARTGPMAKADPLLWTGSSITFSQTVANSTSRDTIITNFVQLTRNNTKWLFNTAAGQTAAVAGSPSNTLWAFAMRSGTNIVISSLADVTNLSYQSFDSYRTVNPGSFDITLLGNKQMVMWVTNLDIYIPVKFTAWPHGGGRFAYIRSTAPPVAPTVSITNPVNGAVFAEPANVQIQASAAVSSGSVTNVLFLANGVSFGSDSTPPFGVTNNGLAAGAYALTAVAIAAGTSTTSPVVNISVVSPVDVALTAPQITNNVFSFNYTANPGLRYFVQNSSNLIDWLSVATNVAVGNPVHYTSPLPPDDARYFRVGRLPNP
ncbi:MAG TPA: Ig-like domain-containing protein [Verrucomicrobiae bacterium]|nr:Ig-like domain-containing protein [Verrucomicrobiae bacterium]